MQIELLRKLLNSLAAVAESNNASSTARDLNELRTLFPTGEKITVGKFIAGLPQQPSSAGPQPRDMDRLRQFLRAVERLLLDSPKDASRDLALLIAFLGTSREETIGDFVANIQNMRSSPKPEKPGGAKGPSGTSAGFKGSKELRTELVDTCVRDLQQYEHDNVAFDEVVQNLKNNRDVREQEMREIATRYLGYKIAKKKKEAWQAIVDRQAVDARQTARKPHQVS